jgi:hypothetical protein
MAFFSLNPEQMKKYVDSVNEYASFLETERNNIRKKSEGNGDPVPTMLRAVEKDVRIAAPLAPPSQVLGQPQSSFSPALGLTPNTNQLVGLVSILSTAASELQVRYNEVVYLNSQGVSSYNADGTLSYYLPDPPEGQDPSVYWATMDTAANVTQYNSKSVDNGKNSAEKLKKALDSGDEAAASKELAEINKHRDVPAYSAMFCQTMGVADMMDAPLKLQRLQAYSSEKLELKNGILDTFGHMMAAASTLYDEDSNKPSVSASGSKTPWNLRTEIYNAVVEQPGRATVLDAFMTSNGTVYDTDFLVHLAADMEKIPSWPPEYTVPPAGHLHDQNNSWVYSDTYLLDHTTDPLAAVLHGMGNNPEAANEYLASADSDDPMLGGNDSDDLWAPSAAARNRMQMLASRNWTTKSLEGLSAAFAAASVERVPAPGNDKDDRATWATANGITILAKQNIPDGEVKRNVGVMLGNSGAEVIRIAEHANIVPTDNEDYKTVPITIAGGNEKEIRDALAHLIYDVSDSSEADFEIIKGTTAFTAARASAVAVADGSSIDALKSVYDSESNVLGMLRTLNQSATDKAYNGALAATGALSVLPVVGPLFTIGNSGLTLAGAPKVKTGGHADATTLRGAAYTNAFNQGLIKNPPDPSTTSWYSVDSNGGSHITLENDKQIAEFNDWVIGGAGDSWDVVSRLNEIGVNPAAQPWGSEEAFKEEYNGKDW